MFGIKDPSQPGAVPYQRRLVLALGVVASVPILVAAAHAVVVGWMPTGDRAYFAVRAFDVFSGRSPLVGPWSSGATAAVGQTVYSPGPLLYWLLAIPARFLNESLLQVTSGLINVACVVGALALARRRGGLPFLFATAIAIPVMTASLPPETHSDLWNSSAPLFPLVLLVFLCWSLACGEYRLLPVTVLVASFAAETHLTYVVPVVGLLIVGLGGLAATRPFRRSERVGRWVLGAGAVALICWSAPLIDQATNSPGNLSLLVDAATTSEPTLGHLTGWHALLHMIGMVPWWLSDPRSATERITDIAAAPTRVAVGSAVLVLAGLAAAGLLGWRRRRYDVCAAVALSLVLCASVAIDAATTPRKAFVTVDYTLRWASPGGMCVWLLLGWSLLTLIHPTRFLVPRRAATLAGLVVALGTSVIVAISVTPVSEPYDQMRTIGERLSARLPDRGATRVDGTSFDALAFKAGAVYLLRRAGKDVVATGARPVLGSAYDASRGFERVARIDVGDLSATAPPESPGRRLVRLTYSASGGDQPDRTVTVTLRPAER